MWWCCVKPSIHGTQSQGMGLILNLQDRQTHQRNNEVKRRFGFFYCRIRAMLNGAWLKDEVRNRVWAECATWQQLICQTLHWWHLVLCVRLKRYLEAKLGEIRVATKKHNIEGKLKNRGTLFIRVGHFIKVSSNVSRMLNLETYDIVPSRDLFWLWKKLAMKTWTIIMMYLKLEVKSSSLRESIKCE